MIKYSEMEKDFTIDCDGCGNFFPVFSKDKIYTVNSQKGIDVIKEIYRFRFCSQRCHDFVLERIELIKKNLGVKP